MHAYILLTYSKTVPSRLVRIWTGDVYTHAAIALGSPLHTYSFGRKSKHNFLNGGFIEEQLNQQEADLRLMILRLSVSAEQFRNLSAVLHDFCLRKNELSYNFLGILGFILHQQMNRKNSFFCSQFVAAVLANSGICTFAKPNYLIKPADFIRMHGTEPVFEGRIADYLQHVQATAQPPSAEAVRSFA